MEAGGTAGRYSETEHGIKCYSEAYIKCHDSSVYQQHYGTEAKRQDTVLVIHFLSASSATRPIVSAETYTNTA